MNRGKLLLATVALLLAYQSAWAQYGPTSASQVRALAALGALTGKGVPLVPAAAPGHYRPHLWVAGELTGVQTSGKTSAKVPLPSFCNKVQNGGGFLWCPNALQTAYQVNSIKNANGGAGMTIGIVAAYHYVNNEADLNFFSGDMGLPPCTRATGCFTNLDQSGNSASNTSCGSNPAWELETMLDLEWAHAMAPNAKLLLVEACTASFADVNAAVTTAAGIANVVVNSYGTPEFAGEHVNDPIYYSPTLILASAGDGGSAGKSYPCASVNVVCVGGTSFVPDPTTFQRLLTASGETAWSNSGGGCAIASEEPAPAYQTANNVTACGGVAGSRAMPDIAALADSTTGVAVYDSGNGAYFTVGGTSLATAVMGGIIADIDTARFFPTFWPPLPPLSGSNPLATRHFLNESLYGKYYSYGWYSLIPPYTSNPTAPSPTGYFFDVTIGANPLPAGGGYDLVTGLGVLYGPYAAPPLGGVGLPK